MTFLSRLSLHNLSIWTLYPDYLISLVHELRKLPKETGGGAEFKHNIAEADEIGEYISAWRKNDG